MPRRQQRVPPRSFGCSTSAFAGHRRAFAGLLSRAAALRDRRRPMRSCSRASTTPSMAAAIRSRRRPTTARSSSCSRRWTAWSSGFRNSAIVCGDVETEADWRLFPSLVRFDPCYYVGYKCNLRRLDEYPESVELSSRSVPDTGHRRGLRHRRHESAACSARPARSARTASFPSALRSIIQGPMTATGSRASSEVCTVPTLNLPAAGGKLASYTTRPPKKFPKADKPFNRIAYAAAHVVRRSARRRQSVARCADRLGRHHRVPPPSVVARPRRRRGDGHRAARHGHGLAEFAGADPPEPRRGEGFPRRADRLRRRHRSHHARARTSPSTT